MLKLVQLSSILMRKYSPHARVLWRNVVIQDAFIAARFSEQTWAKMDSAHNEDSAPKKIGNYKDFVVAVGRAAVSGKRIVNDSNNEKNEKQLTTEILNLLQSFPSIQISDSKQHPDIQKFIDRIINESPKMKTLDFFNLATEFLYNLNPKDSLVMKKWESILTEKVKAQQKDDKLKWAFALRRLLRGKNTLEIDSAFSKTDLINSLRAVALYSSNKRNTSKSDLISQGQDSYKYILSEDDLSIAERVVLLLHRLSHDSTKQLPNYAVEALEKFANSNYHPSENTNIYEILMLLEAFFERNDSNPKLKEMIESYIEFLSKHHRQISKTTFEEVASILERIGAKFRNSYAFEKLVDSYIETTMKDSSARVSPKNIAFSRVLAIARKIGYSNIQQFERIENYLLVQYKKKYLKATDLLNSIRALSDLRYEPQQLLLTLRSEANETILQTEPRLLLPVFKSFASLGTLEVFDQRAIQHVSNTLITLSTHREALVLDRNIIGAYIQLRSKLSAEQKKIFFENVKIIAQKIQTKFLVLFLISVTQECGQQVPFETDYIYLRALLEFVVKQRFHELDLKTKKEYLMSSVGLLSSFGSQLYNNEISVVDVDEFFKKYKNFTECKPGTLCLNTEFLNQFASATLTGKSEYLSLASSLAEAHEIATRFLIHLQDESALEKYLESEFTNFIAGKGNLDTIYAVAKRKESIDQKIIENIKKTAAVPSIISKITADVSSDGKAIQIHGATNKRTRTHNYSAILYFANLLYYNKLIDRDTVIGLVKQFSQAVSQFNFRELLSFKKLVGESELTQYIDNYPAFLDKLVYESHKANLTPSLAYQLLSNVPVGYFDESTTVRLEEMIIKGYAKPASTKLFKIFNKYSLSHYRSSQLAKATAEKILESGVPIEFMNIENIYNYAQVMEQTNCFSEKIANKLLQTAQEIPMQAPIDWSYAVSLSFLVRESGVGVNQLLEYERGLKEIASKEGNEVSAIAVLAMDALRKEGPEAAESLKNVIERISKVPELNENESLALSSIIMTLSRDSLLAKELTTANSFIASALIPQKEVSELTPNALHKIENLFRVGIPSKNELFSGLFDKMRAKEITTSFEGTLKVMICLINSGYNYTEEELKYAVNTISRAQDVKFKRIENVFLMLELLAPLKEKYGVSSIEPALNRLERCVLNFSGAHKVHELKQIYLVYAEKGLGSSKFLSDLEDIIRRDG